MPRSASAERGILLAVRLPTVISPMDCASENGLLVIADAAAQIAHLGDETQLLNRLPFGAQSLKHGADHSDLTCRFLCRVFKFRAISFAGGDPKAPNIRAQKLL